MRCVQCDAELVAPPFAARRVISWRSSVASFGRPIFTLALRKCYFLPRVGRGSLSLHITMIGTSARRAIGAGRAIVCATLLFGCAQAIRNDPVNQPLTGNKPRQIEAALQPDVGTNSDDMVIAMSFSGGGMRAAAFSYGVLTGMGETRVRSRTGTLSLLDRLDFLSGVSGGAIPAAYYGLKGREGMADFKQSFLLADAEESLQTNLGFVNIARGLQGGVNDPSQFPVWLDNHLFNHATMKDLLARPRPRIWINASDIYNRTAFIFAPVKFSALCSDITTYPVSLAVAASAAVPVVFTPIVIQDYTGDCPIALPEWVRRVRNDPEAAPLILLGLGLLGVGQSRCRLSS